MRHEPAMNIEVPAIEVHDLSAAYHHGPVIYGVDAQIPAGAIVGIIGPNGAGKSTLLKAIAGLITPAGGWVKIFGRPWREVCRRVSYMPQRESVDWDFPVDVMDVVLMGRTPHLGLGRRPGPADLAIARECLERTGLSSLARRQIGRLSGGQQQRVFLARALAQQADVYLMDEPFAGVDAASEASILGVLRGLRDQGKTLLVVHHDLSTARDHFDYLLLLNMRLVAFGPTSEVFRADLLQKTYGGRLAILDEVARSLGQDSK
ncbi:MAG: metal ABC transporter ATP-binding protein [Terrimicrobiaceae bacterium]|nr:metal ABC transporter ATP-binding protein [Terrimicrobiaceae bacterium]